MPGIRWNLFRRTLVCGLSLLLLLLCSCQSSIQASAPPRSSSSLPVSVHTLPAPSPRPRSSPPSLPSSPSVPSTSALPVPVPCPQCWHPSGRISWQWQLQGSINQSFNVNMYDIDLFDNSSSVVASLHVKKRVVICYLDAGTWENWRPDAKQFPASVLGKSNGWPGERWLDIRNLKVLGPLLQARMQQCKAKGFDGVEFDNVDGYTNGAGFPLTAHDQLLFNSWLANQAHTLGLSVALKNDLDQIPALLPYFDWALDEQCFEYEECETLQPFIQAHKAVMEVEYNLNPGRFCAKANNMSFNSLKKHLGLDPYRVSC